jgi:hypothetical protein
MTTLAEYFEYLDNLRNSGITNMFAAGICLQEDCGLTRGEAREVLKKWMNTFDSARLPEERAMDA